MCHASASINDLLQNVSQSQPPPNNSPLHGDFVRFLDAYEPQSHTEVLRIARLFNSLTMMGLFAADVFIRQLITSGLHLLLHVKCGECTCTCCPGLLAEIYLSRDVNGNGNGNDCPSPSLATRVSQASRVDEPGLMYCIYSEQAGRHWHYVFHFPCNGAT